MKKADARPFRLKFPCPWRPSRRVKVWVTCCRGGSGELLVLSAGSVLASPSAGGPFQPETLASPEPPRKLILPLPQWSNKKTKKSIHELALFPRWSKKEEAYLNLDISLKKSQARMLASVLKQDSKNIIPAFFQTLDSKTT